MVEVITGKFFRHKIVWLHSMLAYHACSQLYPRIFWRRRNYLILVPGSRWLDFLSDAASMVNRVFCSNSSDGSTLQQLTSDATIEVIQSRALSWICLNIVGSSWTWSLCFVDFQVTIDIPFPFRALPVEAIESSGRQVLEQLLRAMLPRFLKQVSYVLPYFYHDTHLFSTIFYNRIAMYWVQSYSIIVSSIKFMSMRWGRIGCQALLSMLADLGSSDSSHTCFVCVSA